MAMQKKWLRVLSLILFIIGVLIGLSFAGFAIWANLEASLFEADMPGDADLALHCPTVITADETGTISATFTNTATWDVTLTVKAHISQGNISYYREESALLRLAPGESQEVTWTVTGDKLVYGRFIFVKVANQRLAPILGRIGTCGILVLDVPVLSGLAVVILSVVLALIFMAAGYFTWRQINRTLTHGPALDVQRAMLWLMIVVVAAMLCGIFRAWLPGIIVLVIALLLIAEVLHQYTQGSTDGLA